MGDTIDITSCAKEIPPHPCDGEVPCTPEKTCPIPFICTEIIKNPALPGEETRCKIGPFMYARTCAKVFPPHPCDPKPPCSSRTPEQVWKRKSCREPPLCLERVKNPVRTPRFDEFCDPDK